MEGGVEHDAGRHSPGQVYDTKAESVSKFQIFCRAIRIKSSLGLGGIRRGGLNPGKLGAGEQVFEVLVNAGGDAGLEFFPGIVLATGEEVGDADVVVGLAELVALGLGVLGLGGEAEEVVGADAAKEVEADGLGPTVGP